MLKPRSLALLATAGLAVAAVPAYAATKTVEVDDNRFSPSSVTVKKGTVVKWRWVGDAPHNVVVVKGPRKFSSSLKRSGTYRRKLRRKGTYRIVCTIHPGMDMRVRFR